MTMINATEITEIIHSTQKRKRWTAFEKQKLVEGILNQILEAQVTESLGAEKHERSDERIG